MPQPRHIHKLKRHKYKTGNIIYFCVLDCNYKVAPALVLGKTTICWICGEPFLMNEYSLRLANPHCPACHKPKGSKPLKSAQVRIQMSVQDETIENLRSRMSEFETEEEEI